MGKPTFNPIRDVISGVIMASTSVPQLIAYAETVGYAGYRGMMTAGVPLVAWGLATGNPYMNAGVTSVTALMVKSDLNGESYMAEHGEDKYVRLVASYSFYVGVASILLALVGFGKLAKAVPKPVRTGCQWGCAVGVLLSAAPNGFFSMGSKELKGLVSSDDVWGQILTPQFKSKFPGGVNVVQFLYAMSHPWLWSQEATIVFLVGTAYIMVGKKYLPSFLPPGTEVILVTALSTLYSANFSYGSSVVGEIPAVDPDAGIRVAGIIPVPVEFLDMRELLTTDSADLLKQFGDSYGFLALSCCIFAGLNFFSVMGIASTFENEDGIPWSAERELVAQGVSCVAASAVGSAPVSGSLSRSLVSRMTGATSQFACIVTALCWIYLQPYMSVMTPTPKAALSAVIVSAVVRGVVNPKNMLLLSGLDAAVGWTTGIITCSMSPTQGFGLGLVLYYVLRALSPSSSKDDGGGDGKSKKQKTS